MVNLLPEVYNILSAIAPSFYQYPQILIDTSTAGTIPSQSYFPMISYFDSDHVAEQFQDGQNSADIVEITIDVWERVDSDTGDLNSIYANVDSAMRTNKYIRSFFSNQFEEDTLINHYTYKFKKIQEETPL